MIKEKSTTIKGIIQNLENTYTGVLFYINGTPIRFDTTFVPEWVQNGAFVEVDLTAGKISLLVTRVNSPR